MKRAESKNQSQLLPTVYFDIKTSVAQVNEREIKNYLTKNCSPNDAAFALEFLREAVEILSNNGTSRAALSKDATDKIGKS